jgi:NodT family efflux transporter outer membrane factor (OMF) lipoprotein
MLACLDGAIRCKKIALAHLLLGTLGLSVGCKVGPDYLRNDPVLKSNWSHSDSYRMTGAPAQLHAWWQHFQDPVLDQFIAQAIDQNLTLREAGWRIIEARARRNVVAGNLAPQFQAAEGSFSRARLSRNQANFFSFPGVFEPDLNPENWSLGATAAWELDFWGRFRRAVESADASLDATCAAYDEARVLLLAEVAQTYVEMRTLEHRLALGRRNLEIQEGTLSIAQRKKEAGLGDGLDIAQAESNIGQTGATLPALEILRLQASHRLCVLLGRQPIDLALEVGVTEQVPVPPQNLAFGIPSDLLRRRPDVRRVERELAAQSARIGIAEAEFYPHISLAGNIGVASEDFGKLFSAGSGVGIISPNFSWNLLNYGRIKNNLKAEQALFQARCNAYRNTVLNALQEAEDAQVAYIYGFDRAEYLRMATRGAASAVEKAEALYQAGSIDFGRVYVLQSALLIQQDELAATEGDIAISLIQLFKALGGGWESSTTLTSLVSSPSHELQHAPSLPSEAILPQVPGAYQGDPVENIPIVPEPFQFLEP